MKTKFINQLREKISLYSILFLIGIILYLFTHLIKIEDFPIYFFCDEATKPILAEELIKNHFKDQFGNFLPPFFNYGTVFSYNLGLSVYLNLPAFLLFGKKIWAVRGTSVVITLLGSIITSLTLKNIFRVKNYWSSLLFLSSIPIFFLHSRTGFETVISTSFYAFFIYYYLLYRIKKPYFIFPASLFAAASFYSYAGTWMTIAASYVLFMIVDIRYHLKNLRFFILGILFSLILFLPFISYQQKKQNILPDFSRYFNSYLVRNIPVNEKIERFFSNYKLSFDPNFLFVYQLSSHPRHYLKDYGLFPLWTLPVILIGFLYLLRQLNKPEYRILLICLLVAPLGGVIAELGPTRIMLLVIPFACLFGLSIKLLENWWEKLFQKNVTDYFLSLMFFIPMSVFSLYLTYISITQGPLWFQDYGLYGMQYGTKQLFGRVNHVLDTYQNAVVSSNYANLPEVYIPFFLSEEKQKRTRTMHINDYLRQVLPTKKVAIFAVPYEYQELLKSGVLKDITVKYIIYAPNGEPAFYQLELDYQDNAEELIKTRIIL